MLVSEVSMTTIFRPAGVLLGLAVMLAPLGAAAARHEITHKGTVVSADAKTLKVNVPNEKTKKVDAMAFTHDRETKILRGDTVVSFTEARIQKGEKIAVTIDHDDDPTFALVVRLDVRK
jgi:transcriptional antiterminator Rof (Rho-off)